MVCRRCRVTCTNRGAGRCSSSSQYINGGYGTCRTPTSETIVSPNYPSLTCSAGRKLGYVKCTGYNTISMTCRRCRVTCANKGAGRCSTGSQYINGGTGPSITCTTGTLVGSATCAGPNIAMECRACAVTCANSGRGTCSSASQTIVSPNYPSITCTGKRYGYTAGGAE
eukprot:TRINITY_DN175_c1_g1_i14.p1 TRINITY_DN175_c1_g1~~TRINITY_DN175_c1_g1_i14.p1  ORF type:complete len:169 (-),score=35.79 TRINITY_DN175_c1_g1_i14:393-899(-)